MSIAPGTRFGSFDVQAPLGAGAMGEVYRARDTRLNRDVALKVLPATVGTDPERLARLNREAQTLAALNHPGIAAIYGFEEAHGALALVLELVEGETLDTRIARGAIPLDEALPMAVQIASALQAAHEAGIVHRDLKPANIRITPDGVVKLLDFGIAKALGADASMATLAPTMSPTLSPTLSPTMPVAATAAGTLMGTATYMAPEQARGKPVDQRADIWAFGCVLFEMLAGRRAFDPSTSSGSSRAESRDDGDNISDVIAAILKSEPDWSALPATTPAGVRRLLRHCLEKDRRERLQAIGDARLELRDVMSGPEPAVATAAPTRSVMIGPAAAAAAVAALLAGGAVWLLKPAPETAVPVTRSLLGIDPFDRRATLPAGQARVTRRARRALALSPDGQTLVIRALGELTEYLWVRRLDSLEVTQLAGTDAADLPFFSPDGAWIGFYADAQIKKIPVGGGVVTSVARVPGAERFPPIFGASWGGDTIVFATAEGIWQVPAAGGEPKLVSQPADAEYRHSLPHLLPGGEAMLFTVTTASFRWDDAKVAVRVLASGEQKVVLDNAIDPLYADGQLLFMRGGTLMAVPFDTSSLGVTGPPVPVASGVMQAINAGNTANDTGSAQVAVSTNGTMVYATGGFVPPFIRGLVWINRTGDTTPLPLPDRQYSTPRLSPDGRRLAVSIGPDAQRRIWVADAERGGLTPITEPAQLAFWNIWSPDSTRIIFGDNARHLAVRNADGTGTAERLMTSRAFPSPSSWSADGRYLLYVERAAATAEDIWVMDLSTAERTRTPVLQTTASEMYPTFSPDGKWMAYTSTDSGRTEVYVQPFPGPGARVQVTFEQGNQPAWGKGGSELYFVTPSRTPGFGTMMMANVRASATSIDVGTPRRMFEARFSLTNPVRGYDVAADGSRFLVVVQRDQPPVPPVELVLVQNWPALVGAGY